MCISEQIQVCFKNVHTKQTGVCETYHLETDNKNNKKRRQCALKQTEKL